MTSQNPGGKPPQMHVAFVDVQKMSSEAFAIYLQYFLPLMFPWSHFKMLHFTKQLPFWDQGLLHKAGLSKRAAAHDILSIQIQKLGNRQLLLYLCVNRHLGFFWKSISWCSASGPLTDLMQVQIFELLGQMQVLMALLHRCYLSPPSCPVRLLLSESLFIIHLLCH